MLIFESYNIIGSTHYHHIPARDVNLCPDSRGDTLHVTQIFCIFMRSGGLIIYH